MSNPLVDAIPSAASVTRATTRSGIAEAVALPLVNAAAVTAFNSMDLSTDGTPYPSVIYNGTVYDYDSADTTTAHDPSGGCIVSGDGRRYKRAVAIKPDHIVLDKDLTAPPGSPASGDAYYVATSATGAWAGHSGEYAVYGARGWTFRAVDEGHILYVTDEASFYHMPASGTLTKGLGELALGDASVEVKLLESKFGVRVEAQQNAPPGSLSDRVKYIVGTSPSGAWTGQNNKIAEYDSTAAAWVFHAVAAGDEVYNIALGYRVRYSGSAWVQAEAQNPRADVNFIHIVNQVYDNGGAGFTFAASPGNYINLLSVPITGVAGQRVAIDLFLHDFLLEGKKDASFSSDLDSLCHFFVRKDTSATSLYQRTVSSTVVVTTSWTTILAAIPDAHIRVIDTIADGSPHNYNFGIRLNGAGLTGFDDARLTMKAEVFRSTTTLITA